MIYLRPLNYNDLLRIYEIKSNPNNFSIKFNRLDTTKITKEKIEKWFLNLINETDAVRLGICTKEKHILIGSITLGKINYINSSCELHIYIDSKYQNKGYATESIQILLKYCKNIIKINTIFLEVHKENFKAIHLYKKCGFTFIKEENEFLIFKNDII